jgi:hypothetical protein
MALIPGSPDDVPRDMRGRPPANSPAEERAADLLEAAMRRVNDLLDEVIDRDPSGRWFAMVVDARMRPMDDLYLVEDVLRDLMAAVQRTGDLLDLVGALHFDTLRVPVPWDVIEQPPEPWTRPVEQWPAIIEWNEP